MKKIISVFLTLVLVILLSGCVSTPQGNYDELEDRISALEERFDNLTIVVGLNGNVSIYENDNMTEYASLDEALLYLDNNFMSLDIDTFDPNNLAPDYIKDELGDYISFKELSILLKSKYFENDLEDVNDYYDIGSQAKIKYVLESGQDMNDVFARMVLLIEELRNYEFYLLSCNELSLEVHWNTEGNQHRLMVEIPLVVLTGNYFVFSLDGVYNGDYEIDFSSVQEGLDVSLSQIKYNEYVTNGTFTGYVLNYLP